MSLLVGVVEGYQAIFEEISAWVPSGHSMVLKVDISGEHKPELCTVIGFVYIFVAVWVFQLVLVSIDRQIVAVSIDPDMRRSPPLFTVPFAKAINSSLGHGAG